MRQRGFKPLLITSQTIRRAGEKRDKVRPRRRLHRNDELELFPAEFLIKLQPLAQTPMRTSPVEDENPVDIGVAV